MRGPEHLKNFSPKSIFIRKNVGYLALFLVSALAKMTVKGKWHLPKKNGFIVASNHFSYVDPPFFKYAIQKPISFLAASDQEVEWYFMWALHLYGLYQLIEKTLLHPQLKKQKEY